MGDHSPILSTEVALCVKSSMMTATLLCAGLRVNGLERSPFARSQSLRRTAIFPSLLHGQTFTIKGGTTGEAVLFGIVTSVQ